MKSDIILAGVGGQGILTIANVLCSAALKTNLYIKQAEVHGMSQRGGDVHSTLRLSSDEIYSDLIPLGAADLIVSMEPMEALRYLPFLKKDGAIVTNITPFINIENYPDATALNNAYMALECKKILIDADTIAKQAGNARSGNIVLLGAASLFIEIDKQAIEDEVRAHFSAKGSAVEDANAEAYRKGVEAAEKYLYSHEANKLNA